MINIDNYLNHLYHDKFTIFLFHGVVNELDTQVRNYNNKHIFAADFENLLIQLKELGNPLSMDDVIDFYENNIPLPQRSYAITFDDGFENNFSVAVPILEKNSTPATFYISTNLVNKNLMSWIDQIEYCFEITDTISIRLPWDDNSIELNSKESKIKCLKNIRKQVKANQNLYVPEVIVSMIFDQCNIDMISSNDHPLDKKMNWDQVSNIYKHKLFTVGGHSHNHLSLGSLDTSIMGQEIDFSIHYLNKKADISSCHYSYPEGQEIDFNDDVIETLKKNGIKCCPTAMEGVNELTIGSLFHLKRVMVD